MVDVGMDDFDIVEHKTIARGVNKSGGGCGEGEKERKCKDLDLRLD